MIFRSFSSAAAAISGVVILLFQTAPAAAQAIAVDVELVLAVDVSASIDRTEIDLQRAGYLSALTQPDVVDAMLSGPLGRIAVTFVEWSLTQRSTIGWTIIDSPAAAPTRSPPRWPRSRNFPGA